MGTDRLVWFLIDAWVTLCCFYLWLQLKIDSKARA